MAQRFLVREMTSSLQFTGGAATDKVTIVANSNQINLTNITICAWVFPRSLGGSSKGRIFDKATNTYISLRLDTSAGNGLYLQAGWTSSPTWRTTSLPEYRKWTHVSITYNFSLSSDPIFYFNALPVSSSENIAPSGSILSDSTDLCIGNSLAAARAWDGYINDVRYYNKILSQSEINDVYYNGKNPNDSSCVGWWKLNENTGSTVVDSTGNANGTITNATWSTLRKFAARTAI